MLVSIIIPVYNVELYLRDCLNSVINQTYTNLEIILVDDGSKDASGKICDEYTNNDSRIKVIHQVNQGLSDARNNGYAISTGDAIFYLDSDDYVDTDIIEKLVNTMKATNADMVISSILSIKNGNIINTFNPVKSTSGKEMLTKYLIPTWCKYIYAWGKLIKREKYNISFPSGRTSEDMFSIPTLYINCDNIAGISDSNVYYRQRGDSITKFKNITRDIDIFDGYMSMCNVYIKNSLSETKGMELLLRRIGMKLVLCASWRNNSKENKELYKSLHSRFKELFDSLNKKNYSLSNKVLLLVIYHSPITIYTAKK